MGIKNLLPFVEKACRQGNITEFEGKTLAIDVSCLLHRSFTGCVYEVANGQRSDKYIKFIKRYIDLLLAQKCHVIMVFDGQRLPAKNDVNTKRGINRQKNLELGQMSMHDGDEAQAFKYFQMSTRITADIVEHTIEEFRQTENVDILVAPYEADAQLAYLIKRRIVDAVITEDSDLIPFGCNTIIFKLDPNGACRIFDKSLLHRCFHRNLSSKFTINVIRRVCIMSGCDYFPEGIPKVGLKKAVDLFSKSKHANDFSQIIQLLKRVPFSLDLRGVRVTDGMIKSFLEAEFTFLHQIVFDPIKRSHVPLTKHPDNLPEDVIKYLKADNGSSFWFAGKTLPDEDAFRMALGNSNLAVVDKFSLSDPPVWSIYHADRFTNLEEEQENESEVESIADSGYSSFNSQTNSSSSSSKNVSPLLLAQRLSHDLMSPVVQKAEMHQVLQSNPQNIQKPSPPLVKSVPSTSSLNSSHRTTTSCFGNSKCSKSPVTVHTLNTSLRAKPRIIKVVEVKTSQNHQAPIDAFKSRRSTNDFSFPKWSSQIPPISPRGTKRVSSDVLENQSGEKKKVWNPQLLASPPVSHSLPAPRKSPNYAPNAFKYQSFKSSFPKVISPPQKES